jgi:hypothetical protein
MDTLTCYVGQGALAVVRNGTEAVFVDSLLPSSDEKLQQGVEAMLERLLRDYAAMGLILTGFDGDHCCPN